MNCATDVSSRLQASLHQELQAHLIPPVAAGLRANDLGRHGHHRLARCTPKLQHEVIRRWLARQVQPHAAQRDVLALAEERLAQALVRTDGAGVDRLLERHARPAATFEAMAMPRPASGTDHRRRPARMAAGSGASRLPPRRPCRPVGAGWNAYSVSLWRSP